MAGIVSGKLSAFFLFDVAETFDLRAVDTLAGPTTQSRLTTRPTTCSSLAAPPSRSYCAASASR